MPSTRLALASMAVITLTLPPAAQANPMLPVADGPEFMVSTDETYNKSRPVVAAHPDGRMVAVWSSFGQDGHGLGIFAQRFGADGLPAGGEFQANTHTSNHQAYPAVAYSANGSFVIVWQSDGQDGSGWGIYGQRFDAGGTPAGSEFLVNETTQGSQERPAIAIDSAGNFVVVWEQSIPFEGWGFFARRFDAGGSALGGDFQVNTEPQFHQAQPASVAFLPDGGFLMVWSARFSGETDRRIYARRYDEDGDVMGTEYPVSAPSEDHQYRPVVAFNASGQGLAVWHETTVDSPSRRGVQARRLDAQGQVAGSQLQVNQHDEQNHEDAWAALDVAGNALVTWAGIQPEGANWDIYARYLPADGNPCLPEFRVNTTTSDHQLRPVVGMAGDGRALVVWYNTGFDDRDYILGQRYDPPAGIFLDRFTPCP